MSTRNNNFSNRRHVGKIIVEHGTKNPKEEYGDEKHPGLSCKDIQLHSKMQNKENGVYWITLRQGKAISLVFVRQ